MEAAMEWYYAVPLLFTVLAVLLASLFVKLRASAGDKAAADEGEPRAPEAKASVAAAAAAPAAREGGGEASPGAPEEDGEGPPKRAGGEGARGKADGLPEEGAAAAGKERREEQDDDVEEEEDAAARTAKAPPQSPPPPEMKTAPGPEAAAAAEGEEQEDDEDDEGEEDEEESKEEDQESETEKLVVREPESENVDEQFSFKYSPGKLRGNQYKTLLTKEELEEEQRIQRQQLAAIFSLMKEKAETFGEMSETDIKEQLKLYDM